jgi:type II secretion system protein G
MNNRGHRTGFTIVELLIVIVVIAILAAITIVAYNGIQERARFSSYRSDIAMINKAVLLYYADNGAYPGGATGNCWTNVASGTGNFISGLAPTYIQKIPDTPNWSGGQNYYAYCFSANGADYKVLRLAPSGQTVPSIESSSDVKMDPSRPGRAWGIWSPGGSGL